MFNHVRPGDPAPSAADWNGAMDAAKAHRSAAQAAPVTRELPLKDRAVYIRNETAGGLPTGSILGITGPIILPENNLPFFKEKHYLKGGAPTEADAGKFAVTLAPLGEGMTGECVVSGLAKVLVDDGAGDFATVVDGETSYLARGEEGAPILWVDSTEYSTGRYWAIVLLGGGAGSGDCGPCPNIFELTTVGNVTGGSATLTFTINGTTGSAATIDWNDSAADAKSSIITANAAELDTSNFTVQDGPWPLGAMYLVFKGSLAETMVPLPAIGNSLTGTNTSVRIRRFSAPFGSPGWI